MYILYDIFQMASLTVRHYMFFFFVFLLFTEPLVETYIPPYITSTLHYFHRYYLTCSSDRLKLKSCVQTT